MLLHPTQTLVQLALLGVCLGLTDGQATADYILVQKPMPWSKAREFCQNHFVDLAVLSTEEQYFALLNATASDNVSYWLGLQRRSRGDSWKWVNGEELGYQQWLLSHSEGRCASLEAMLKKEHKMLPPLCTELHMPVCQGPVSPQSVAVNSVSAHHLSLSWNVSTFMQTTPHSYNITICSKSCKTLVYSYTGGPALMNINIANQTSAPEYFVALTAFVVRPDNHTGEQRILQDLPITLLIKTGDPHEWRYFLCLFLKLLKFVSLAPPLWVLYKIFKKDAEDCLQPDQDISPVLLIEE